MVVGLAGAARTGKTTAALHLIDAGFAEYAFAEPIKKGLEAMFGLSESQLYGDEKDQPIPWLGVTPRRLAQTLGTEWGRGIESDLWVLCARRWLSRVPRYWPGVVFSDIRYENEAAMVRACGGTILHLRRDAAPCVEPHSSETGIDVREGDLVINNNSTTDELYARLNDILCVPRTNAK